MDDVKVESALVKISEVLSGVAEKLTVVQRDVERLSERLATNGEELIVHRMSISSNTEEIKEIKLSMQRYKEYAIHEAVSRMKIWFLSAAVPGLVSLILWLVQKVLR